MERVLGRGVNLRSAHSTFGSPTRVRRHALARYTSTLVLVISAGFVFAGLDIDPEHPHPIDIADEAAPASEAANAEDGVAPAMPVVAPGAEEPFVHVVEAGDRLGSIATKYNVTTTSILVANPDVDPDVLQVDQRLLIPGATTQSSPAGVAPAEAPSASTMSGKVVRHIVADGDLLVGLAERYGTPVEHIKALNRLADDHIFVGQHLLIPPPSLAIDH